MTKPRWFRSAKDHAFGWEIYGWRCFFLTISIGSFEIQLNKWLREGVSYEHEQ